MNLTVSVLSYGINGAVTWSSSNENVATVDSNGRVTAQGKGKAQIMASGAGVSAMNEFVQVEEEKGSGGCGRVSEESNDPSLGFKLE